MFELREHQQDALDAILSDKTGIGRVVIPTGGGKTCVEAFSLREFVNEDARDIHVVLAPRIALVNQLIREYRSFIGQSYIALAFHSGRHEPDYEKVKWAERATTSTEVIDEEFARAQRLGKDLVIFSTYASVHKLVEEGYLFDTLIADESQYCVAENHFESVRDLDSRRKYFFTATEKHTVTTDGRGLNNEEVFGDVLYQVAPATLIEKGYIVAPRLHVMSCDRPDDKCTVLDEVLQIAKKQSEMSAEMPVTKILFAMKGTDDVAKIVDKVAEIKKAMPNYKVFTILSNAKYGAMVDGKKMGRGDFFKVLREEDHALIFHYDILSEGIDVDGITGVALMRNMGHAKLLQTIGRAVRIYKADPSAKKQAWVSVMTVNGNDESSAHLERVVRLIRDGGFEVNVEEVEFTDNEGFGIGDEEDLDDVVSADRKGAGKAALENVMHNIEMNEYFEAQSTRETVDLMEDF
jgi:superfamily II DNA or RNA helicase